MRLYDAFDAWCERCAHWLAAKRHRAGIFLTFMVGFTVGFTWLVTSALTSPDPFSHKPAPLPVPWAVLFWPLLGAFVGYLTSSVWTTAVRSFWKAWRAR